jgi:uncharacterized lipoprotein YddW (UPF0748 family)
VVQRWKNIWGLGFAFVGIVGLMLLVNGSAELALKVTGPDGESHAITARNAVRGSEALILYDAAFGQFTKTNGYGVEVVAVPATSSLKEAKSYQVTSVTNVWECQKDPALSCGNAAIPEEGVVFSAMGSKREWLKKIKPGDILHVQQAWFHHQQSPLDVINPSPANNPMGSGFPGFRASNQLIMYNSDYSQPSTGTNEFGFEVTVRNGIVTAQEGSDSSIPSDGFVLSGHGRGRSWLIANAPIGARIELSPEGDIVTSYTDFNTYVYQFDQQWAQSPCADQAWREKGSVDSACIAIRDKKDRAVRLYQEGQPDLAAKTIVEALENTHRRIWANYKAFPADAVRGAWHRPVEKTPVAVGQTLDKLKAAGINSVFLETFFHGYTIFPSNTYQEYGLPLQNPKFQGVDLLQTWVEQAHQRNMKVHVWFQTFYGGTKAYLPPGPIFTKYPGWANVQYSALLPLAPSRQSLKEVPTSVVSNVYKSPALSGPPTGEKPAVAATVPLKSPEQPVPSTLELGGYFLDPANPEVQTFLLKLASEIVTRYDVDGFQLDYIRYPASFPSDRFSYRKTTWGYTDVSRKAFKAQYGVDPVDIDPKNPEFESLWKAWNGYKVAQINNFVQKAAQTLRQKKTDIQISAAVFPDTESALALKHQDWSVWALNGWVDFYTPMTLSSAIKVVDRDIRNMLSVTQGKIPVYSGIFGPFNNNEAGHVLSQIDTAKQAGASGYVLFDTAHISAPMLEALKTVQRPQQTVVPNSVIKKPQIETPPAKPKKRRWWRRD